MRIIYKIGNEELLNKDKSLFLCSKHAPYSVYDKVFGWVDSLTADDCVICFNSSELGVGGEPSMPEELYLIPINSVSQIQSKPSMLKQFKRKIVNKWLSIDEFKEKNVP